MHWPRGLQRATSLPSEMALPQQLAQLMAAVQPFLTTPVVAGSAFALLLTLLALACGVGRPAAKKRAVKAKPATPKPKTVAAKSPPPAKAAAAKAPPKTPGTDVRRSARCVTCGASFEAPASFSQCCSNRARIARAQGAHCDREGRRSGARVSQGVQGARRTVCRRANSPRTPLHCRALAQRIACASRALLPSVAHCRVPLPTDTSGEGGQDAGPRFAAPQARLSHTRTHRTVSTRIYCTARESLAGHRA